MNNITFIPNHHKRLPRKLKKKIASDLYSAFPIVKVLPELKFFLVNEYCVAKCRYDKK